MMTPAQQIAVWADRLRDISARGLRYCQNIYDRENYQIIQDMALEMLALATNALPEQIEALRAPLFTRPGPFPFGDAAIIDETGRILLIKRADNQMWAMPGGGMDVGETPAEGVVREALEETGLRVEPLTLVGVYDSRLCGTLTRHQLYQFVFLCRPIDNEARQQPA
ncbi:MAG TPA: NUDIX hydrolase N-terminal domain-containing protein, partial [Anaerolineae bacterium]